MSEVVQGKSPEQGSNFETLEVPAQRSPETATLSPEQQAERQAEKLQAIRQDVKQEAVASEHLALPLDDKPAETHSYINRAVQAMGLKQNLRHIRRKLPAAERALSVVIHQPVVRAVSEASGKTVTRPSGLLGGGLCAFLGSLAYLYLARHIGFSYNYLLFTLFFVGGFAVGVLLELLLILFRPRHQEQ